MAAGGLSRGEAVGETEAGHPWLARLMVATLYTFGLKRGGGRGQLLSEFCVRAPAAPLRCVDRLTRGDAGARGSAARRGARRWGGDERSWGCGWQPSGGTEILVFADLRTVDICY